MSSKVHTTHTTTPALSLRTLARAWKTDSTWCMTHALRTTMHPYRMPYTPRVEAPATACFRSYATSIMRL